MLADLSMVPLSGPMADLAFRVEMVSFEPINVCPMSYRILMWLSLLFIPLLAKGQNFSFRQYSASDGLPSSTVYALDQDSEKVLWMGTGNGLCQFDGKNFQSYSIEDGLINNVVYGLAIDHLDRKWMSTLAAQPSFFSEGRGAIPSWGDSLSVGNYYFLALDTFLWFSGQDMASSAQARTLARVTSNNQLHLTTIGGGVMGWTGFQVDSTIYFSDRGALYQLVGDSLERVKGLRIPQLLNSCWELDGGAICIERHLGKPDRLVHLDLIKRKITYIKQVDSYLEQHRLNALLVDQEGHLWLGLADGLLFMEDRNSSPNYLLPSTFVNDLYLDHENNLWVSTDGKGLFFLMSSTVRSLKKISSGENTIVRSLATSASGDIFVGYTNGWLEVYDAAFQLKISRQYSDYRIVDILPDEEGAWLASNSEVIRIDQEGKVLQVARTNAAIKSIAQMGDQLYVLSYSIQVLKDGKIEKVDIPFSARIYANYPIDAQNMFLGSTEGLAKLSHGAVKKIAPNRIYSDIRGIGKDGKGVFWIATAGQGVFAIQGDRIVKQITTRDGLSSNICMHLFAEEESIWVSTNLGINKIDLVSGDVQTVNEEDGLSSLEVKYIAKSGSFVVAAASGSLDIIPEQIKSYGEPPVLQLKQVLINGDTMPSQSQYSLPYYKNDLLIRFGSVSFKSMGKVIYAYRLAGLDKEWIETKSEQASWSVVPPGTYQFLLKVRGSNGEWSPIEERHILIRLPWWREWWFLTGVTLLVGGVLVFAYQRQQANFNKESALQRRMQNLQLTALRAQMNPHFMFNALSSIQEFINHNDLISANLYLSRFASLVRSVLNHSTQERISLEEEVSQLELYLTLENLRFDQQINYEIVMKRPLQAKKVFIPTMIIQPFVENALNHGLFHQKKEKRLQIRFLQVGDNRLHCQIEDNGIGRQRSSEINQNRKYKGKSKGIQVTRDRLELLNKSNDARLVLEIEDLQDVDGNPTGTLVHLMIPFSYTKDSVT